MLRAGSDDAPTRERALEELCLTYWPPVYALYRSQSLSADDAADLTQSLFADLLDRRDFDRADPERGRFRGWLATCAKHHLANHRARDRADKRGGGRRPIPLDALAAEERRFCAEPSSVRDDPARAFDRRWAQGVIETALARLEESERGQGRGELFELLRPTLEGGGPPRPWATVAAELGGTEGALKVRAHRLRGRFREFLIAEARDTLGEHDGAEAELRHLLAALES